jgi:CBS domain-containing protein
MLGGEPLPEGRSVFGTLDISTPTRGGGRGAMAAARPTVMSSMLSTRMLGSAADRRGSEPLLSNRQPVVGFDFTGEPLATDDDIRNSGADRATALARVRALLSEDDLQCVLDLRPFLNATPFTVHVHAPLARVYRLFRGLGLRHLVCVDDAHDVVGIITRSSLTEPFIHKVYHDKFPSSSSRGHSSSS